MPAMMNLPRVADLYPPAPDPELLQQARAVATNDRDDKGNFVLRRSLTTDERRAFLNRVDKLTPWLKAGKASEIAQAVAAMKSGFGTKSTTEREAQVVITQYVTALADIPLWAVQRACMRFSNNAVKDEELGQKQTWDRQFGPSTAHLRAIAIDILRPYGEESTRLWMTIRGTPERSETPEQREAGKAKVSALMDDFKTQMASLALKDTIEENALQERRADAMRRSNEAALRAEYVRAGLEPPAVIRTSLSLLLQRGYTIQEVEGRSVLVAPPPDTGPTVMRGLYGETTIVTKPEQPTRARNVGDIAMDTVKGAGS